MALSSPCPSHMPPVAHTYLDRDKIGWACAKWWVLRKVPTNSMDGMDVLVRSSSATRVATGDLINVP